MGPIVCRETILLKVRFSGDHRFDKKAQTYWIVSFHINNRSDDVYFYTRQAEVSKCHKEVGRCSD